MNQVNIGGHEVTLKIPEDAMVTGVIAIATYQRMDGDEVAAGTVWASSAIPYVQVVGMMRLATIDIERIGDYS